MRAAKKTPFPLLCCRYGLLFLLTITLFKMVISTVIQGGFSAMLRTYFAQDTWRPFMERQLLLSLVYGLLMAGYYKFVKK